MNLEKPTLDIIFYFYIGRGPLFGFARGACPFVGGTSLLQLQSSPQHGNSLHTGHSLIFRTPRSPIFL